MRRIPRGAMALFGLHHAVLSGAGVAGFGSGLVEPGRGGGPVGKPPGVPKPSVRRPGSRDCPVAQRTAPLPTVRLTLELPEGMDGRAAAEYFRQQGCEPEYADRRCAIFLFSPLHTEEDFERLENALRRLPAAGLPHGKGRGCGRPELSLADAVDRPPPERVLSPRQVMLCPAETVPGAPGSGTCRSPGRVSLSAGGGGRCPRRTAG